MQCYNNTIHTELTQPTNLSDLQYKSLTLLQGSVFNLSPAFEIIAFGSLNGICNYGLDKLQNVNYPFLVIWFFRTGTKLLCWRKAKYSSCQCESNNITFYISTNVSPLPGLLRKLSRQKIDGELRITTKDLETWSPFDKSFFLTSPEW